MSEERRPRVERWTLLPDTLSDGGGDDNDDGEDDDEDKACH